MQTSRCVVVVQEVAKERSETMNWSGSTMTDDVHPRVSNDIQKRDLDGSHVGEYRKQSHTRTFFQLQRVGVGQRQKHSRGCCVWKRI